ncbi:MAG: tetratricopeptide repeat protein [candidate division WOR-3 bacterium]
MNPEDLFALKNKASILAKMKKFDIALELLEKALKVKPDYKDALLEKAFILIEKNNLNSEDATAYYNRACAYALIGDKKNWIININS